MSIDIEIVREPGQARESSVQTIERALAILELVSERGGASAKEVSAALGYPIATVYRLMQALVQADYLVHLRAEHRFELGFKLDRLGVSLHRQIGVPRTVRAEVSRLHERASAAAYFAVYRGADVIVAHVVDSARSPRLTPLTFGFHQAAHATAFGKILLAAMAHDEVAGYLDVHGMPKLTGETITDAAAFSAHLAEVSQRGIAWERGEFVEGETCAAIGVRNSAGVVVGAVAVSVPLAAIGAARERDLERQLRDAASHISRYYRSGQSRREPADGGG